MTTQLITDWSAHDQAFSDMLGRASRQIDVFDLDLARLPFERKEYAETLRRFLANREDACLRIILRDAAPFRTDSPRLMQLLATYAHKMSVTQCAEQLASLSDSMLLIDNDHALIRFHQDNVRSKRIDNDPDECRPYQLRFAEIAKEHSDPVSATTLGL